MDKIVMIAAVIAVVAIIGVGLLMNQSSSTPVTAQGQPSQGSNNGQGAPNGNENTEPGGNVEEPSERPADNHLPVSNDKSNYTTAQLGVALPDLQGNCTLYKHVVKDEFKCFGTAGNYSTLATNEYRKFINQSDYFCKPTQYGCKLYQTVTFQQ